MSEREETGWDRLKALAKWRYRDGEEAPEELTGVAAAVLAASIAGFLFGGMLGARHAGDKYIRMNHSTKYQSSMQAQRELHGAAMLGFVRQGCKWGWKVALFTTIFSTTHTLLTVYREKDGVANYVSAGALTGGSFRLSWGVKPIIGGAVLGTLVSLPAGLLIQGLDLLLVGREQRRQLFRERREARQRREEEWLVKLRSTDSLIGVLELELEGRSDSSSAGAGSGSGSDTVGLQDYYSVGVSNGSKSDS